MKVERSAGTIVFRIENGKRLYLLLENQRKIDFPKGNIEKGENTIAAAKRETAEEAGINDLKFIEGFKQMIKVFYTWGGEKRLKFITFFLAETKTEMVRLSFEHQNYYWLAYEPTHEKLTYKNSKEIIEKAENFIRSVYN